MSEHVKRNQLAKQVGSAKGDSVDRDQSKSGDRPQPIFTRGTSYESTGGASLNLNGAKHYYKSYADPADGLANGRNQYIEIYHIPSGNNLFFKAYLTGFQDNFKTDYNKEQVFGRMDPIVTYKHTARSITISFTVPSTSTEEAKENLAKANNLVQMLYPVYEEGTGASATAMKSGPIFKVKFGNLIVKPGTDLCAGAAKDLGLPCVIEGFSYVPKLDEGFYDPATSIKQETTSIPSTEQSLWRGWRQGPPTISTINRGNFDGSLYPQTIEVSLELTVLHDTPLGWEDKDGEVSWRGEGFFGSRFPYGGDNKASEGQTLRTRIPPKIIPSDWKARLNIQKQLLNRRLAIKAGKILGPVKEAKKFFGV